MYEFPRQPERDQRALLRPSLFHRMTGNSFVDLLLLMLPVVVLGLWWTGARAREHATEQARLACQRQGVQFLDQTVALQSMKPVRVAGGSMCLRRAFGFEFTDHGDYRDTAQVTMDGPRLVRVNFPWRRDADGNRVLEH